MRKIYLIAFIHFVLLGIGSNLIELMVFGVGFSDSEVAKYSYRWVLNIVNYLNFPMHLIKPYIILEFNRNLIVWAIIQLLVSFGWANIYALLWSKLFSHNKAGQGTP